MQYTYKILLHKEPDGGFTVTVPALPGCVTYGEDVDEAMSMAKEAVELYIEELQGEGRNDSRRYEYTGIFLESRCMNLSSKFLIQILLQNGFVYKRSKGSHHVYYNLLTNKTVIVPVHGGRDLKKGTFLTILKQAGIDKSDLL